MDVEQTQAAEVPAGTTDTTSDEASDADLIAAAQAAGGAESVDVAAEEAAAGKPATAATPTTPEPPPDEPKIAAVLRAREKAFAERAQAEDYAAQRRAKADEEAAQLVAQARKRAADDYEAELQARRNKFKESPTQAIRDLGFQTQDMVDAVTREGTAEWRQMRELEARARAAEERAAGVDTVKKDYEAFKAEIQQQQFQAQKQAVEQRFLTELAPPEKAPYLHKRYEPQEILQKAHALAFSWKQAGVPFDNGDVAAYLEHEARQRLAGVPVPAQQVSAGGSVQKVRTNGSRTLSAASGSERRASPKPIDEMSPDEERAALIEAAAEARRSGG